ncbi:thioredoxin domain-containing protein [Solemya velesiana gill symbiont]|uniref:Thioredoxin domain-containing protein n=1 Tax=Solemya velesiana gill symbiont TaxID=1918948 RepID=A0A1T2KUH1_9GAMM|nr:thioredoxin domain-containing protein [Solemya velesiana gill symbiont]OOZ36513.1 thioredoxin domain-containing protein [Solemya velesiana gill symbiont]
MSMNRLAESTSPYLQQHADNPVHWQLWDDEALELARQQDKPILLSIGYSACHWCHVMAHESFEDEETAALMNELFINIKVDREERPDLDKIYLSAHQLLTQRPGGWPLTVFLMPGDQVPFFAGTYFPRESRYGMPPFKDVLASIANAYREQRHDIEGQNRAFMEAMSSLNPQTPVTDTNLEAAPLESARQQLARSFDETHGGFGQAPKFPLPTSLQRILRHWAATRISGRDDPRALYVADYSLTRMALGGFNDQLDGGFYRYSVDDQWMIPHFEKMLYDNGPLLTLYTDLWQATGKALFQETAIKTADWVIREMQSPEGGYYSTLDADSEGEEGLFYLWSPEEVKGLLERDEYQHLAAYYGLDREANFEGRWHLHNFTSIAELNQRLDSSSDQAHGLLSSAREKLFKARGDRIRPGRDEKILTAWNALMIKGMARAGRVLNKPEYTASADRALGFIRSSLWHEGRLLATHKDGKSALPAYLDDYAFLIDALLELLQTRWNRSDLDFALELTEVLLTHFQDGECGGFYFTADDHEALIHRPKPLGDDAIPSGNGIAAHALNRLGHLLGEPRYLETAEGTLKAAWDHLSQVPHAHCALLEALEEQLHPPEIIIIRGSGADLEQWSVRAAQQLAPRRLALSIPTPETDLPTLLDKDHQGDITGAYICSGTTCEPTISDFEQFDQRLSESKCTPPTEQERAFTGSAGSFKRHRE